MLKITLYIFFLTYSLSAFSYGKGVCVNFANGEMKCISDIDENSEIALNLKKQAADSFKSAEAIMKRNQENSNQEDYINGARESVINMLIQATQKYKQGALSKEKYIEVAMQVGAMAEYANRNHEEIYKDLPKESKDIKVADKIEKFSQMIPYGSPNIENVSDEELIKLENKQIPALREKFKALQSLQKNIGISELNLKCSSGNDCEAAAFGQKICGGPVSYLVVSKLDSKYDSIISKLAKFTQLDNEFQKNLYGFMGTCDFVVPPKISCENNICKGRAN